MRPPPAATGERGHPARFFTPTVGRGGPPRRDSHRRRNQSDDRAGGPYPKSHAVGMPALSFPRTKESRIQGKTHLFLRHRQPAPNKTVRTSADGSGTLATRNSRKAFWFDGPLAKQPKERRPYSSLSQEPPRRGSETTQRSDPPACPASRHGRRQGDGKPNQSEDTVGRSSAFIRPVDHGTHPRAHLSPLDA